MDKNTFCPFPFETIFLGADAGIKTCCTSRMDLGNLNDSDIDSIIHGENAQSVRQHILDGKWHKQCFQCKEIESMGGRSERSAALLNHQAFEEYQKIELDKNYFKLRNFDPRWTNTCNLACNYCYEYFSSQWSQIKGIQVNTVNENNQESLFLLVEKSKETIRSVNLLGGEPLLQKQNLRLLDILSDKKFYVLTNLSVPITKNKVAKKLFETKNAHWGVSFETVGKRFEYVRHNADWDLFTFNLDYLKKHKPSEVSINAHPLYCLYSAFNLVEYYDFVLKDSTFDGVYWHVLQSIEGLNVFKLPHALKEKAILEIEKCESEFENVSGMNDLIELKTNLIESIDERVTVKKNFSKFTQTTETLLQDKKHTFEELWPDLANDLKSNNF